MPRKTKLPTESHIVLDPRVNLTKKIVEIVRGYESRANDLYTLQIRCVDYSRTRLASSWVPNTMHNLVAL